MASVVCIAVLAILGQANAYVCGDSRPSFEVACSGAQPQQVLQAAAPRFVAAPQPQFVAAPQPQFVAAPQPQFVAAPQPQFVAAPQPQIVAAPQLVRSVPSSQVQSVDLASVLGQASGSGSGSGERVDSNTYQVALDNTGPSSVNCPPVIRSQKQAPAIQRPTITIPTRIPGPRTVCNQCRCIKTIVKPQVCQQLISVPIIQRYIQTTHRPVVEKIHYQAVPTNAQDSLQCAPGSGSDLLSSGSDLLSVAAQSSGAALLAPSAGASLVAVPAPSSGASLVTVPSSGASLLGQLQAPSFVPVGAADVSQSCY